MKSDGIGKVGACFRCLVKNILECDLNVEKSESCESLKEAHFR